MYVCGGGGEGGQARAARGARCACLGLAPRKKGARARERLLALFLFLFLFLFSHAGDGPDPPAPAFRPRVRGGRLIRSNAGSDPRATPSASPPWNPSRHVFADVSRSHWIQRNPSPRRSERSRIRPAGGEGARQSLEAPDRERARAAAAAAGGRHTGRAGRATGGKGGGEGEGGGGGAGAFLWARAWGAPAGRGANSHARRAGGGKKRLLGGMSFFQRLVSYWMNQVRRQAGSRGESAAARALLAYPARGQSVLS